MLRFVERMKPEFVNSLTHILRTRKETFKKQVNYIPIPNRKFFNKEFIALLFIQHGRIPTAIDTSTFRNRVMVACEDGEVWSGRLNLAESNSVFVMQLPSFEEQDSELDSV